MSKQLYPLIFDYKYDSQQISLCENSSRKVTFSQPSEDEEYVITNNNTYITYDALYKYDKVGDRQLCILSHFVKIHRSPEWSKGNEIIFWLDTMNENMENANFRNAIVRIVEQIKNIITKMYPMAIESKDVPYTDGDDNSKLIKVRLLSFKDAINKQNIIMTPIHYHQPKSKGGNVIVFKNKNVMETIKDISENMKMFRHKQYGKEVNDDDDSKKKLYYEAKCSLAFSALISDIKLDTKDDNGIIVKSEHKIYYTIKIHAKEMEIKCNMSYVKPILNSDVSYVNISKSIESLSI